MRFAPKSMSVSLTKGLVGVEVEMTGHRLIGRKLSDKLETMSVVMTRESFPGFVAKLVEKQAEFASKPH